MEPLFFRVAFVSVAFFVSWLVMLWCAFSYALKCGSEKGRFFSTLVVFTAGLLMVASFMVALMAAKPFWR